VIQQCICNAPVPEPKSPTLPFMHVDVPNSPVSGKPASRQSASRRPASHPPVQGQPVDERAQLHTYLARYLPVQDFPIVATNTGEQVTSMMLKYAGDFVLGAVKLMGDPRVRAEYPDVNRRYKYVSELLFAGIYKNMVRMKKSVLAMYTWKHYQ
jgi:hypothetical protein